MSSSKSPLDSTLSRTQILSMATIGVIGAGVSGLAAIRLLRALAKSDPSAGFAPEIVVLDDRWQSKGVQDQAKALDFAAVGDLTQLLDRQPQLIIISPGVADDHPIYAACAPNADQNKDQRTVPILSEIDLAYLLCPVPMVGVTGTNGKSTVTQLIADMGQSLGIDSIAGGNIGVAAAQLAADHLAAPEGSGKGPQGAERTQKSAPEDAQDLSGSEPLWILELSSYQLDQSHHIELKGAIITSFSEDHQERHKTLGNYFRAKWEIINRISTGGFVVIHNETLRAMSVLAPDVWQRLTWRSDIEYLVLHSEKERKDGEDVKSQGIRQHRIMLSSMSVSEGQDLHSLSAPLSVSNSFLQTGLQRRLTDASGTVLMHFDQPFCQYGHNLSNAALAFLAISELSPSVDASKLDRVLTEFKGLPYRFQPLWDSDRLAIINDSKSTNLESLETALQSIPTADVILLVGGVAGSPSYINLNHYHDKLKWVLCFGQDGDKIYTELNAISRKSHVQGGLAAAIALAASKIDELLTSHDHDEAVQEGADQSPRKLVLLFSPGCKSFDEFANFVERGAFFERTIKKAQGYNSWLHNRQ